MILKIRNSSNVWQFSSLPSLFTCLLSVIFSLVLFRLLFSLSLSSFSVSLWLCLDVTHCKFEKSSRTTRARFLQSVALPDEAVQLQLSWKKLRREPAVSWFGQSSAPSAADDWHNNTQQHRITEHNKTKDSDTRHEAAPHKQTNSNTKTHTTTRK